MVDGLEAERAGLVTPAMKRSTTLAQFGQDEVDVPPAVGTKIFVRVNQFVDVPLTMPGLRQAGWRSILGLS